MSRPRKYANKRERLKAIRAQTRERVARWIAQHPRRWNRIMSGMLPTWMKAEMKGTKLTKEDFLIK